MAKNELVTAANQAVSSADFFDEDMMTGPTGFENVSAQDILIPRLTIIQKMSDQLDDHKAAYIEGARYGDFCDTGTGEVFKELTIVPVFFANVYIEWYPRESGKGLAKNHGTDASCMKNATPDEKNRMVLPNGNYIADTATWYILNLTANRRRSFIPLTSTSIKHSRKWMTLLTSERLKRKDGTEFQPPMWYRSWKATTIEESNTQGSWKSWRFSPGDPILALDPTKTILREAMEFYEQARDGLVRGDVVAAAEEHARRNDADVPF